MNSTAFLDKLHEKLGSKIKQDFFTAYCYKSDIGKTIKNSPIAIAFPENSEDVSTILKTANDFNIPVTILGGGTTIGGETVAKNSIIIDTKKMNKCFYIDNNEKAAVIGSGITWLDLYDILRRHGLTFKVAPSSASCTIGGTASVGGFDNHSYIHGTSADQIEEIELVSPIGDIITCNPEKDNEVFSNILYGNGMIGIITKIKMKIIDKYKKSYDSWFVYSNRKDALNDYFNLCENQVGNGIMYLETFGQHIVRIENYEEPVDKNKIKGKCINISDNTDFYINACRFMYAQRIRLHSFPFLIRYKPISINFIDIVYPDKDYIYETFNYSDKLWKNAKKDIHVLGNLKLCLALRVKEDSKTRPFSPIPSSVKKGDLIFGSYFGAEIATDDYSNYQEQFTFEMINKAIDIGGMLYKYGGHVKQFAPKLFSEERWKNLMEIKKKYDPNNILNRGVLFE